MGELKSTFAALATAVTLATSPVYSAEKAPTVKAGNVALSQKTQWEVAAFLKAHPEMVGEFMPFEQDCIDGKKVDVKCEENVKGQLADLENEVRVNAKEKQVNAESDMVNRATIVTVVLQLNNAIQYNNPDRSGIVALDRIKDTKLQKDISFMKSIDAKLAQKVAITPQETTTLQAILVNQAWEILRIYSSFTPAQQQRFINTKTIAVWAQKYALK